MTGGNTTVNLTSLLNVNLLNSKLQSKVDESENGGDTTNAAKTVPPSSGGAESSSKNNNILQSKTTSNNQPSSTMSNGSKIANGQFNTGMTSSSSGSNNHGVDNKAGNILFYDYTKLVFGEDSEDENSTAEILRKRRASNYYTKEEFVKLKQTFAKLDWSHDRDCFASPISDEDFQLEHGDYSSLLYRLLVGFLTYYAAKFDPVKDIISIKENSFRKEGKYNGSYHVVIQDPVEPNRWLGCRQFKLSALNVVLNNLNFVF